MDAPDATVVVISHERPALRDRAVRSVLDGLAAAGVSLPVLVLDSSRTPRAVPDGARLIHRPDDPSCVSKRRLAFELTDSAWVVMLDDDCRVVPDGLGVLLRTIAEQHPRRTGAIFVNADFVGERTRAFDAALHSDLLAGFADITTEGDVTWAVTTLSAFRREAVLGADLFARQRNGAPVGGEDVDACIRLRAAGWRLHGVPKVLAWHDTETWNSFAQNARRSRNYGWAESELVRHYPQRSRLGYENPVVSAALGALCARLVAGGRGLSPLSTAAAAATGWLVSEAVELAGRHPEATPLEVGTQTAWSVLYESGRVRSAARRRRPDLLVKRFNWGNPDAGRFSFRIGPGIRKRLLVTGAAAAATALLLRGRRR
ncbi:hypothetical protein Val02_88070 [Virgisporangium aliadipatigenens]|uniref:Glycosyltransferase n=1 Tax=Virgisporangium aliadipatigenens TaxID=741659 RepID=A0A8J3YYA6_9ACTN|nr:glycosyltransferase [Virgisporangium aliadipatigenens]GIJ51921.1 hypothetical protein Val02_88070 [Virgisporangium aliadipatigenens]